MTYARRRSSRQREEFYDRCRGDQEFPLCNLCALPIHPGQDWDVSHDKHLPRALGGAVAGIAHRRCNRLWNNRHDTPLIAKNKRRRQKHIGAWRPQQTIVGSRLSGWKHFMRGGWERRR